MRISDWSSDVCSSDLVAAPFVLILPRRIGYGLGFSRRVEIHAGKDRLKTEAFKESRCLMRVAVAGQLLDGETDEERKLDAVHVEIGGTSCRERVGTDMQLTVVAV